MKLKSTFKPTHRMNLVKNGIFLHFDEFLKCYLIREAIANEIRFIKSLFGSFFPKTTDYKLSSMFELN